MKGKTGKMEEMEMKNPEQEWYIEYVTEVLMDCFPKSGSSEVSHIMQRGPL